MVNHSCCPNSDYYFVKDAAMLRAGRDLKAGQNCCAFSIKRMYAGSALRCNALFVMYLIA